MSIADPVPPPPDAPPSSRSGLRAVARAVPTTFEQLTAVVRARVDADAPAAFERARRRALSLGPEVAESVAAVQALTARGGKRVRPSLVALGAWAASGEIDVDALAPAFVAYELFQSYLLVHDDWIDGDAVRRGGPSVPAALADAYGNAELGAHTGVLAGDLACALSFEELARCPLPPERVLAALRLMTRVHGDVVLGQLADVLGPTMRLPPAVERVHGLKTGSYTVEGPLVLGATLGGACDALVDGLRALAGPLGLAFQLRDDLLGTFGDERLTGKPTFGDVRGGKRTALVAEVEGDPEAMRLFRAARGDAPADAVFAFVERLETSGARARVDETLRARLGEARSALGRLDVSDAVRRVLADAIEALGVRRT